MTITVRRQRRPQRTCLRGVDGDGRFRLLAACGIVLLTSVFAVSPAAAQSLEDVIRQNDALRQQNEQLMRQNQQLINMIQQNADRLNRLEAQQAQQQATIGKIEQLESKQQELAAKTAADSSNRRAVSSGNDKVKLTLSGQVNRGVLYVDNGDSEEFFHVDNDNSSTRVRFIGEAPLDDEFKVGTQIEVQFESNSTAAIRIDQDSPAGPNSFTERKLELYADSKTFGRLWVGQGDTASNGTSEQDISGTGVIAYSGVADYAGGIAFFDDRTQSLGPRINQAFSNFDGLSRDDRLRYDTPKFGGFFASTSAVDGGSWDVAGRFAGEIEGTRIVAAASYANASSRQGFEQVSGSASVLFPNGISVTGAIGEREIDGRNSGDDPVFYYAKLGYTFNPLSFGATSVAIDYTAVDDLAQDGDEFAAYGAFLVQNFDKIGTEFYAGVRNHELDRADADFDDIFAALTGARVKF